MTGNHNIPILTLLFFTTPLVCFLILRTSNQEKTNREFNTILKPIIEYFSKKSIEHRNGVLHSPINIPYRDITNLKKILKKSEKSIFEEQFMKYMDTVILLSSDENKNSHNRRELLRRASEISDSIVVLIKK